MSTARRRPARALNISVPQSHSNRRKPKPGPREIKMLVSEPRRGTPPGHHFVPHGQQPEGSVSNLDTIRLERGLSLPRSRHKRPRIGRLHPGERLVELRERLGVSAELEVGHGKVEANLRILAKPLNGLLQFLHRIVVVPALI